MVKPGKRKIQASTLWAMAWRSLFLQACWNFQRMQNVGFAFTLLPLIRKLRTSRDARIQMLKRHLEFFNTHPYCAAIIFGVVAHFEEQAQISQPGSESQAMRLKGGMMGPLAALGDTVYWATLKPALALLGVCWILLSPSGQVWPALVGPILFLGLFTIFHLGLRIGGIFVGYERGIEIIKDLRNFNPQLIARRIGVFIAVVLGSGIGVYIAQHAVYHDHSPGVGALVLAGLLGGLFHCLRARFSATWLFYALVVAAVLVSWTGWF